MQTTIQKQYLEVLDLIEGQSSGDTENMDYVQLDHCIRKVEREQARLRHEADAISFKIHLARALSIHLRSRQRALDEAEVDR
jgi:hypothetical protein